MVRSFVFTTLLAGAGIGAWTSWMDAQEPPATWAVNEIRALATDERARLVRAETAPVSEADIRDAKYVSNETLEQITCGPWDVSAVAMETILDEMIRRGWRPPTRSEAVEASYGYSPVEAVDPNAPAVISGNQARAPADSTPAPDDATRPTVIDIQPEQSGTTTGQSVIAQPALPQPQVTAPPAVTQPLANGAPPAAVDPSISAYSLPAPEEN